MQPARQMVGRLTMGIVTRPIQLRQPVVRVCACCHTCDDEGAPNKAHASTRPTAELPKPPTPPALIGGLFRVTAEPWQREWEQTAMSREQQEVCACNCTLRGGMVQCQCNELVCVSPVPGSACYATTAQEQ
jgi:hypothetical protein